MNAQFPPDKLFKYRSFSTSTLRLLTQGEVFFAKPSTFNDPFDCDPEVLVDVDWRDVERLWKSIALKQMGKAGLTEKMAGYRANVTEKGAHNDDADGTAAYLQYLVSDINAYLTEQFKDYGVLSMASSWDNPLMWSHYADNHHGICIEYETDDHCCEVLGPVNYRSSRFIHVSDLHQWLVRRSAATRKKIFDQYFFAKAPEWKYEKEWRALSKKNGRAARPFRISAIHFGLRCDSAIVTTIAKLYDVPWDETKFYRVAPRADGFKLRRYQLDDWEIAAYGLRESAHFADDNVDFEFDPLNATGKISGRKLD